MNEASDNRDQPFELKFTGTDIHPDSVRARDLAEVIEPFDKMISISVLAEHADIRREDLVISFVYIEDGSVKLRFLPNLRPLALAALQTVAPAVSTGDYQQVPNQAVKCMKTIQNFTKRHNCVAEFMMRVPPELHKTVVNLLQKSFFAAPFDTAAAMAFSKIWQEKNPTDEVIARQLDLLEGA